MHPAPMHLHALRVFLLAAGVASPPLAASAAVFVNEVMANPGLIDWNGDGTANASTDEYVEIVNRDVREVDLGGWTLSDEVGVRHTFPLYTVLRPGGSIVVFGGGVAPGIPGVVFAASTGQLGLSNTGDTVTLSDGTEIVDGVSFGVPTAGTSINRSPDASAGAPFELHDLVPGASGTGSPGRPVDQSFFAAPPGTLPFINEWLPRPATLLNDWNGDGFATDAGDEFVEILNPASGAAIDLAGWTLRDAATLYHEFAPGTVLAPGASVVVVAGAPVGIPGLALDGMPWGNISNSADDLYLEDELGGLVSHVRHASSLPDISWNRDPDGAPETSFFALHADLAPGRFSSPGAQVDGTPFPTPEPGAAFAAALAALAAVSRAAARRPAAGGRA